MSKTEGIWRPKPTEEDYKAATTYLELLFEPAAATALVRALRRAPTVQREAKDLLRAARLAVLDKESPHVAADLKKIEKGKKLSPVLIVRGNGAQGVPLIVADGYHRICASWLWDENTPVSCCLTGLPRHRL
jgi:hypothetical protein